MSEIKNGGLDQYGAGPFKKQQSGTAGVEGVNPLNTNYSSYLFVMCYKIVHEVQYAK